MLGGLATVGLATVGVLLLVPIRPPMFAKANILKVAELVTVGAPGALGPRAAATRLPATRRMDMAIATIATDLAQEPVMEWLLQRSWLVVMAAWVDSDAVVDGPADPAPRTVGFASTKSSR